MLRTVAVWACAVPALVLLGGRAAHAVDYFWTRTSGGSFTTPQLWDPFPFPTGPFGPGGAGDTVNFDLGTPMASRYTMTGVAGENDRLLVHNDSLTLEIPDGANLVDYSLLNMSAATPALIVGADLGDNGDLVLTGTPDAVLVSGGSSIGHLEGAVGSVLVDKLQWSTSRDLIVGNGGEGDLVIQKGAIVTSSMGYVGSQMSSRGTVAVNNPGSQWNSSNGILVAPSGIGAVQVQDGGVITSSYGVLIGGASTSVGTMIVDGAGSMLATGLLAVQQSGDNMLTVRNGGRVSSEQAFIQDAITVEGENSSLNNIANMIVQAFGGTPASLSISDGATVTSDSAVIGQDAGSAGVVTATGANSSWTLGQNNTLFVGLYGVGALNIDGGAVVNGIEAALGFESGSAGDATVTGATSAWNNTARLIVGWSGDASLRISEGGEASSSGGFIAREFNSASDVTVDGAGSRWTSSSGLYVGGDETFEGGIGGLTISNGAEVVVAGPTKLWSRATVNLQGGRLSTGELVDAGGNFNWSAGEVHITGAGGLTIGPSGFFGSTLSLNASQTLRIDKQLSVQAGGMLSATTLLETGMLTVTATGLVEALGQLDARGVMVQSAGRLVLAGPVQRFGPGAAIEGELEFRNSAVVTGAMTNSGLVELDPSAIVEFADVVSGAGDFSGGGAVVFSGGYAPGASAARVNFDGDVVFETENVLRIELGGATPGTQYDQLLISGSTKLDGEIVVSLIDGFVPTAGQTFQIIQTNAAVTGEFSKETLPKLPGFDFDVKYFAESVEVEVIQLPSQAADFDEDGDVDGDDLAAWRHGFGGSGSASHGEGDADGDLDVDGADFLAWQRQLSVAPVAVAASVPEPSACVVAMVLCAAVVARVRVAQSPA
jgi:T5SS/PEP-CTERM-associated repeat protein